MKDEIEIVINGLRYVAPKRTFSSGKSGYGVYGKQEIDGDRYQISMNIVRIG